MCRHGKALLIGIDQYDEPGIPDLRGCAVDAGRMAELLDRHHNGDRNFSCRVLPRDAGGAKLTRRFLRKQWNELFGSFGGDILFYFSGHGNATNVGGYLVTQDGVRDDYGLPMTELITLANQSSARSVHLILDCCHAGFLGNQPGGAEQAQLREGVTILAASRPEQLATMVGGKSVFTDLVCGALNGGAANVRGHVSAASVYAYVEASLGEWDQRPMYKSHAQEYRSLRRCKPLVSDELLRRLKVFFPDAEHEYPLSPDFENYKLVDGSTDEVVKHEGVPAKIAIREIFKDLQVAGLLCPKFGPDIFWAALRSEPVVLTPLGRFYRDIDI